MALHEHHLETYQVKHDSLLISKREHSLLKQGQNTPSMYFEIAAFLWSALAY
jgi:hypothetical protein